MTTPVSPVNETCMPTRSMHPAGDMAVGLSMGLVSGLLIALEKEQLGADLDEPLSLADVRWHLERLGDLAGDLAEAHLVALRACSDRELTVALEIQAGWHHVKGKWRVHIQRGGPGEAGAAILGGLRKTSAALPTPDREFSFLVELLRDANYAEVPVHQKLHQLVATLTSALRAAPTDSAWLPYVTSQDSIHQGPMDALEWDETLSSLPEAIRCVSPAKCVASGEGEVHLQRAVYTRFGSKLKVQTEQVS